MWLVAIASLAVGLGFFFVGRRISGATTKAENRGSGPPDLVRIIVSPGQACAAALRLESHRFMPLEAPKLPLAECTMAATCRCRCRAVPERRIAARRRGYDRRERIRYDPDNPSRRSGPGRRRKDWIGWAGNLFPYWNGRSIESASEEGSDPPAEIGATSALPEATGDRDTKAAERLP